MRTGSRHAAWSGLSAEMSIAMKSIRGCRQPARCFDGRCCARRFREWTGNDRWRCRTRTRMRGKPRAHSPRRRRRRRSRTSDDCSRAAARRSDSPRADTRRRILSRRLIMMSPMRFLGRRIAELAGVDDRSDHLVGERRDAPRRPERIVRRATPCRRSSASAAATSADRSDRLRTCRSTALDVLHRLPRAQRKPERHQSLHRRVRPDRSAPN